MSDFIAEARVVIRPDTTAFAAQLQAQLAALTAKPVVIPVTAAATGQAATAAVAQSTQQAAAAAQALGAASASAAASTGRLTAAETAAAAAATSLAHAQEQVLGAASAVTAAQVSLTRATAAVAASQRALGLVTRKTDADTVALIVHTEQLARLEQQQAVAALASARAEAERAAAIAASGKAAVASGASLLGLRGAVLTAGAVFLGTTVGIGLFKQALAEATDAEDTFRRATFLLGTELATQLADQSQAIGRAFAIDDDDVLKFETQVGKILKAVGFADDRTAQFSQRIVQLAADMAAFNRVPVENTLQAISLGLAGNTRGLKQYGVLLDNAAVKQQALQQTGKSSADELTRQEIVLARYSLILRDAGLQVGAFADQSDSLTAQSQELKVNLKQLEETVGRGLVPVLNGFVQGLNDSFTALNQAATAAKNFASAIPLIGDSIAGVHLGSFVKDVVNTQVKMAVLGPVVGPVAFAMGLFGDKTEEAGKKLTVFDKIAGAVTLSLGGLSAALDKVAAGVPSAAQQASLSLVLAQAAGDQDAELKLLRQQEQRQEDFLNSLLQTPALTQKALDLQKKAAENLRNTRAQIASILKEQKAAADAAAAAAKAAAAAQERAANAAQAQFLAAQDFARAQADLRISEAAQTPQLTDDIKRQQALKDLALKQIKAINDRIKALHLTGDRLAVMREAILVLRRVVLSVNDALDALADAQAEAAAQRKQALIDAINLDIEFAQITENQSAEVKSRLRLIAILQAQLKKEAKEHGKTTVLYKTIRNEIAQQQKALEDLSDTVGSADSSARFFFEQLQAQQGFVANLLGNVIPRNQTAGLVGVPSAATSAGKGLPPAGFGPVDVGFGAEAAVADGRSRTGPTAGQASTTNEILRRILQQLQILTRSTEAPEARRQNAVGRAVMDGGGGNVDIGI